MAKGKRGLDKRHRDKSGRIERKHVPASARFAKNMVRASPKAAART